MAYNHLTIKTDTRPNGSKILAVNKVDYVNREGIYKDIDEKRMKEHDIFQDIIKGTEPADNPPASEEILYESPFGSILRTIDGSLKISRDASIETVAIALTLAQNLYKDGIQLDGSPKFYSRCCYTVADLSLDIKFQNQKVQERS